MTDALCPHCGTEGPCQLTESEERVHGKDPNRYTCGRCRRHWHVDPIFCVQQPNWMARARAACIKWERKHQKIGTEEAGKERAKKREEERMKRATAADVQRAVEGQDQDEALAKRVARLQELDAIRAKDAGMTASEKMRRARGEV